MSDFFSLSTGESAISESGSFEASTVMAPIPGNTSLVASIDEAKWDTDFNGVNHIKLRWGVMEPKEYSGRKLFQKIWVTDDKPKSKDPAADRDKSKKMLLAIDKNAGGHIAAAGVMPTDESLTKFLSNKMMIIKVSEYDFIPDGQTENKTGNTVFAVSPKKKGPPVASNPASTPSAQSQANAMGVGQPLENDIPF